MTSLIPSPSPLFLTIPPPTIEHCLSPPAATASLGFQAAEADQTNQPGKRISKAARSLPHTHIAQHVLTTVARRYARRTHASAAGRIELPGATLMAAAIAAHALRRAIGPAIHAMPGPQAAGQAGAIVIDAGSRPPHNRPRLLFAVHASFSLVSVNGTKSSSKQPSKSALTNVPE